ncbi:uncharacterized protein LOC8262905 [Ricinus communis]|uniref:DNA binding protein, putative n=1 Tax=Ricinus communis TaxID=3988 RepID=B9SC72_RICCO|nr:uncharacterized protein LOC8262905 [Ricinus communis]EEF38786.1 DNA binding protein, putative [Ricinus communis]|eukprot:XP_002523591.1 uncharacterized protein LOC8262905 [Ricinus communis]
MRKNLNSSLSLGTFPSPGAGNFQEKGWCSERVPHPSGSSRRHISALTPFYSGRTMPSKWEDAERWICSPVLGYGVTKYSQCLHHQRRPKSKSGPIVSPGIAYYSNCSPSMQVVDSSSVRNFIANSPFSTGVLMPKGLVPHYNGGGIGGQTIVARSVSGPGWSDLPSESSSPSSQDEKVDGINDAENTVTRVISRRDMATQMSPEGSTCSSPRERSSSPPSIPPVEQSDHPAKLEIREVQVDKRATLVSRTTRHGSRRSKKGLPDVQDINQNASDSRISLWNVSEASSEFSKLQREEAKITAWENLQKAKAEAAIRKLEMKLEKKRSLSMDKILNKLRTAQIKAQEMRSSIPTTQDPQTPKISHKASFFHRHTRLTSVSSCFTCRAP